MSMHFTQITIGAGATQFSSTSVRIKEIHMENNAGNVMRIANSTVTSSIGISLAASGVGAQSMLHLGPHNAYNMDLKDFFVFGTQNDKLDVMWVA